MSFSFESQGTHTYLVYTVAEDDAIDSMSLGMLTNNKIHGLARTLFTQMDATKNIKYDVSDKISVRQFFAGQVNKKRLIDVFNGIVDAMLSAEDYMIDVNSIILDLDYIFVDVSTCETVLVCLPIVSDDLNNRDFGAFFKNIMFTTRFDQTENCDYVAEIINYLNRSIVFSVADLKKLLENIGGIAAPAQVQQSVVPNPQEQQTQPMVQQPLQQGIPETKFPILAMRHYSKGNAELYKKQLQAAKKSGQTRPATASAAQPKKQLPQAAVSSIPGQNKPIRRATVQQKVPAQQTVANQPTYTEPQMPLGQTMDFGETTVSCGGRVRETTVLGATLAVQVKPRKGRGKNNKKIDLIKSVFRYGKKKSRFDYSVGDTSTISRSYAKITSRDDEHSVDDTNSTKHTYVNGQIIQSNISLAGMQIHDSKLADEGAVCSSCGRVVITGQKFCSECGTPVMQLSAPKVNVSQVQFSAIVPKRFTKGDYAKIDISVYEEVYRNIVDRIIANADDEVREVVASSQEVDANTAIRIRLSSPDIELTDCDETQKWKGKYLTFSFPVEIPSNYSKKQVLFIATVYFNDVIATKLKFIANCFSARDQKIQLTREDVLTAFISYASQDRSRVATIIQGMQKARPDMDIFFDVENLRSGDDWENVLRREIEKRDILFLCWSNYARTSEWVEKEWRYALLNKGIDAIEPIPLVSPVECPPPEELKSKHFNDRALLYR